MRLTLLLLLLCLLPLVAWAQDAEDEDEDGEGVEESIITEVEGRGNNVIVIEELVINLNAGDLTLSRQGRGAEAVRMLQRMLRMFHGGMGPRAMGGPPAQGPGAPRRGPQGHQPGGGRWSPDGQGEGRGPGGGNWHGPGEGHGGGPGNGNWQNQGGGWHNQGGGWPGVTDDVHGGMPHMPGGMDMPHMPGGMDMPHHPGAMDMPHNPEIMGLMQSIPPDVDPDFLRFIFGIGKLAWGDPVFRDQLRALVRDYEQGGGGCEELAPDRAEVR